ncbi:MAG: DUF2341 domain-containing protein [Candidatus Bathyarchaeia archaeon]
MGPLAADLNNDGFMEIVVTGKPSSGGGRIAALNSSDGSILWSQPYGGDHVPLEIIDLNKDGIPEILMGPQYTNGSVWGGVLALHGNNGSVYWYNRNAACKGTYIAVTDINGDGYPEIYSATPGRITATTYDGHIFASTYTYYPCSGGMSIGDTDFDGVFEVYLGERSNTYPPPSSPGRGIRAFWADNLTEIWCDPEILCSSQAPVLADVDKDGDLEIIVLHQRKGIAVYNIDGSVNTYQNIYRRQLSISALPSNGHSNPTVADVDDDGNLELIQCGSADGKWYNPAIWDLVDWKLDAKLPFLSMEPPGVADIDGDGKLEILVPTEQNVTIFKYNKDKGEYDVIYTINDLPRAHPFFIAQDIDNDGDLELVFNQYNSWVSVYDVYVNGAGVPVPSPLPRSGRCFYSEYRTRVPVYVPPSDQAPRISEISPSDGATNVPVSLSELNFKLTDFQSDLMDYNVTTNPDIIGGLHSGTNVPSGTKITIPVISDLAPSTTYTWNVTATDGNHTTTRTFTFYTQGNVTLTVNISPEGSGSVTKNPNKETYAYGERVKLTAVADNLVYRFSGWDGDLEWMGSNNPATILMDGNKIVTAKFTKISYTLTINILPNGSGSGYVYVNKTAYYNDTLRLTYYYNDTVELTAVPNPGWAFLNWTGSINSTQNTITITMNSSKRVNATFTQVPSEQYTLTVNTVGSGTVSKNPDQTSYPNGTVVTLTATPAPGWSFSGWSGDLTGNDSPATVTMDRNKIINATFTQDQYTLTVNVSPEDAGSVTKTPNQTTYTYGTIVQLNATSNEGYVFSHWTGDINSSLNPAYINVTGNKVVTAVFVGAPTVQHTLIIGIEGAGTTNPEQGTHTYYENSTVSVNAIPKPGYTFSHWLLNGSNVGSANPYNVTMDADYNLTAVFTETTPPPNWWNTAWQYRRTITIDYTKVSGELTDFPVLIEITDSSLGEKAQTDGDDFVFTDANNLKLDHQIELYDSATGHLIAWVKVPHLSSTTDTVLYMYYGNSDCGSQQNSTGVWDENYKLVMHLNEETGIHSDSTINGNNGTPYGNLTQGAPGYIGNCVEFNGGYIQLPRIFTTETQFTFSAWIYPKPGARYFISQYLTPYQGAFLQVSGDKVIQLYVNNIMVQKSITINKWYYVVATFDGTTARLYVNDSSPAFAFASNPIWPSQNMYIGDNNFHSRKFYGFIDEVRISNIARSEAWILTEYNNQLNPSQFFSLGPEETFEEI